MKKLKYIFTIIAFVLGWNLNAQNCSSYIKENCNMSEEDGYRYNGQSKSAVFTKGQTSQLKFVSYKGMDYKLTICFDDMFGENVEFKLIDSKSGEVLFYNVDYENTNILEFSSDNSRVLLVEVTTPGDQIASTETNNSTITKKDDKACLAVLIEQKKTQLTGF